MPHAVVGGEVVGGGDARVVGAVEIVAASAVDAEAGQRGPHAVVVGEVDHAAQVDADGVDARPRGASVHRAGNVPWACETLPGAGRSG